MMGDLSLLVVLKLSVPLLVGLTHLPSELWAGEQSPYRRFVSPVAIFPILHILHCLLLRGGRPIFFYSVSEQLFPIYCVLVHPISHIYILVLPGCSRAEKSVQSVSILKPPHSFAKEKIYIYSGLLLSQKEGSMNEISWEFLVALGQRSFIAQLDIHVSL